MVACQEGKKPESGSAYIVCRVTAKDECLLSHFQALYKGMDARFLSVITL